MWSWTLSACNHRNIFFVRVGFNIFNIIPSFILNWIFDIKHNFILKLSVPTVASSVLMEDIDEILSKENITYKLISSKEKKSAPEQTLLTYELVLDNLNIKDDITQKLKELKFEVIDVMWTEKKADKVSDYFLLNQLEIKMKRLIIGHLIFCSQHLHRKNKQQQFLAFCNHYIRSI